MSRATLTIELLADGGKVPDEFRIFAAGMFETTKGIFNFSAKASEAVMAAAADWGNDYCVDYGHSMLSFFQIDPAESMKAAGWFTPAVRGGELWATNVQWTKKASDMIAAREARYISPAFNYDVDGTITELVNAALTNIPATKKQIPLVASRNGAVPPKEQKMSKKNRANAFVLYKLGLAPDADETQVMAALDGLKDKASNIERLKEKLATDIRAELEKEFKTKLEAAGSPDLASLAAKGAVDAGAAQQIRAQSEKQLTDLTGAKSYGEALGVVTAWKTLPDEIAKLNARITELETLGQGASAEVLVDQGVRDGKISPAQKEMWLAIGKKNLEMLKGFLSTASTVVPKKPLTSPENKAKVALTAEQQRAAQKMGITDPKQLEKLSEQLAEAQTLRAGAGQ